MFYIYNEEGIPEACEDVYAYVKFMDKKKQIGLDIVDGVKVSTVFLGISSPGSAFETMVFKSGSVHTYLYERYGNLNDAIAGHARALAQIQMGEY